MSPGMKKFLVWFACIFGASAIMTLFGMSGYNPGFLATVVVWGAAIFIGVTYSRSLNSSKDEEDEKTEE